MPPKKRKVDKTADQRANRILDPLVGSGHFIDQSHVSPTPPKSWVIKLPMASTWITGYFHRHIGYVNQSMY